MASRHAGVEAESQGDQGRRSKQRHLDPDCPPGEPFSHTASASVRALLVAQLPVALRNGFPSRNACLVTFGSETLNFARDMLQSVVAVIAFNPKRRRPTFLVAS